MSRDSGQTTGTPRQPERFWTFFIIGGFLLVVTGSFLLQSPQSAPRAVIPAVPVIDPALVPLATGEEPVQEMFIRSGCASCHTIPGVEGAQGRVGPKLVLGTNGPKRLADPGYRGEARTVREYIHESIVSPSAYVVPGFPDRTMPPWYGKKLSAGALDKIARYLEPLTETPLP